MISVSQLLMIPISLLLLHFISISLSNLPVKGVSWSGAALEWPHSLSSLSDDELQILSVSSSEDYRYFNQTLDAILIPRVPGMPGHDEVKNFISSEMRDLGWKVQKDTFDDRTPHGRKRFTNIVATLNPNACRFLTIACHYDSLYNREYTFLGATDSAVPCAMMIHAAKMLKGPLNFQKQRNQEISLQFIFFDGEEAFKRWSASDSLYGSRHLAAKWNRMKPFPDGLNDGKHCTSRDYASYLDRMDVLVLLDLIGTANPKFYSYFPDTFGLYSYLINIEQRLNSLRLLESDPPESKTYYFDRNSILSFVEDDHVPFMKRGVPIVHLIPSPFPTVWHRETDNRDSLHHPTIDNLNKILRVFIAQYLHLDVSRGYNVMK